MMAPATAVAFALLGVALILGYLRLAAGAYQIVGLLAWVIVGFDMQQADNLFEMFQRVPGTERFEGSGVGLSIARRIVERHGGHICAEAQVGKGARFTFAVSR